MQYKYLGFIEAYKAANAAYCYYCTGEEVDELEAEWGVKLPLSYRELFIILGRNAAFTFDPANTYSIDEFQELQRNAKEIAEESGLDFMSNDNNCLVFSCFITYGDFCFFKLDEGDDPPVYGFNSGNDNYVKISDHFSDYVKSIEKYKKYV